MFADMLFVNEFPLIDWTPAAKHGLNKFVPKTFPGYFTNFLNGLTASLRTYETSEKHKNTTFFRELQVFWSLSLRRLASRLGQKVKDREAGNLNLRFLGGDF